MKNVIKAKKLSKGDVIGFISPASPVENPDKINRAVSYFEKCGYRVELSANLNKQCGFLAGTDEERTDDIHSMFRNKNIKAIMCVRGGYGAPRLLKKLDYSLIKRNPKIFCGYSDITSLQNAIFAKTRLVTFASPMPAVDFCAEADSYTEEVFWDMITEAKIPVVRMPDGEKLYSLTKGKAKGRITGGNLATFVTLPGTKYIPSPDRSILFLEEISESPYRIDRMLAHLMNTGYLDKIEGLILGGFTDCVEHDLDKKTLNLGEVIQNYFTKEINKPAVYNFSHGHITKNATIPLGIMTEVDADSALFKYLESPLED